MKLANRLLPLLVFIVALSAAQERPTPFHPDSAAAWLRVLSIDIGPRPMGSPGEQKAMHYAVQKFQEAGLDEAYVLPFLQAPSQRGAGANTTSGTAVGLLRGRTDRTIVIGAHIDSYSPEGPGANDDGSGSAVVIELARVMAQRDWESTIVFALFGGEESGLKGSYDFAEHYADIDKVALMLQVDMANGSDWLTPLLDLQGYSAPDWLVHAAYEEFDKLGHKGLSYPTHFFTLNNLAGGASSDHEPFLRKGIPAIDFTTDVRDIIHSPMDSYDNFILGGLERSGDLVYRLTERYDSGVPDDPSGLFVTIQIGTSVYLIPFWVLWAFIVATVVAGISALRSVRPSRFEKKGEPRPAIPGLKTLLLSALVMFLLWLSEDIISLLAGLRTPWYSDPGAMISVALVSGLIGIWVSGYFGARMKLSNDLYRYVLRAGIVLAVYISLAALTGPRLAAYPAAGLLFVSLAVMTRRGWLALALLFCGMYPTYRLLDSEVYDFVARTFALIPPGSDFVLTLVLTVFTTILVIPYALVLVGIARSDRYVWPKLPIPLEHPATAVALVLVWCIAAYGVLSSQAYGGVWLQKIDVVQEASVSGGDLRTTVNSTEYLAGTTISFMSLDSVVAENEATVILPTLPFNGSAWLRSDLTPASDGSGALTTVHTWTRPYTLSIRYTTKGGTGKAGIVEAGAGSYSLGLANGVAEATFYSFPDTLILFPISLTLDKPDTVYQTIVATFVEPAVPISVSKENSMVIHRTIVRESRSFFVERSKDHAGTEAVEE